MPDTPREHLKAAALPRRSPVPRLGVDWQSRSASFRESLRAVLRGPRPVKNWPIYAYFAYADRRARLPAKAILLSLVIHVGVFHIHVPGWFRTPPRQQLALPRIELVYYGPARDLPPLQLPGPAKKASPPGEPKQPLPRKGADAFHPRQTILSMPPRITHPRQTLLQPDAPPEPPKLLPELPNIVQWSETKQPPRPRVSFTAPKLSAARARRVAATPAPEVPAVPNLAPTAGQLNIAPSPAVNLRPRLPVAPTAVPVAQARGEAASDTGPTPDIAPVFTGGESSLGRLVALSTTPAEPKPVIEIPPGNLAARITIAPEAVRPGVPGGSDNGAPENRGNAGGAAGSPGGTGAAGGTEVGAGGGGSGAVIPGVSISGGAPETTSNVTGPGSLRPAAPPAVLPERPQPRLNAVNPGIPTRRFPGATAGLEPATPSRGVGNIAPGAPAEAVLGPRRVYTLYVNAPNLTSWTGSWILRFAELSQPDDPPGKSNSEDLSGPLPVRKVDPKYPPELITAKVEGDVTLYAIIRRDGTVDSVRVLRSLDPRLDQHAMEALARWLFRPAERNGEPVELEAVVLIPFRVFRPF